MTYLQFPSLYALPAVPLLVYLASPPHPQVSEQILFLDLFSQAKGLSGSSHTLVQTPI